MADGELGHMVAGLISEDQPLGSHCCCVVQLCDYVAALLGSHGLRNGRLLPGAATSWHELVSRWWSMVVGGCQLQPATGSFTCLHARTAPYCTVAAPFI